MKLDDWPDDVERIFQKPGCGWTPDERERVIKSLFEPWRLAKLLGFTRWCLGSSATKEDAEDAFYDFVSTISKKTKPLDSIIRNYNPEKGRFLRYFLISLRRFCYKRKALMALDSEAAIAIILEEDISQEPFGIISAAELANALQNAINSLPEDQREVFVARYFEGRSYSDIAQQMGITEANARQLCHRALIRVKQYLIQHLEGVDL